MLGSGMYIGSRQKPSDHSPVGKSVAVQSAHTGMTVLVGSISED